MTLRKHEDIENLKKKQQTAFSAELALEKVTHLL